MSLGATEVVPGWTLAQIGVVAFGIGFPLWLGYLARLEYKSKTGLWSGPSILLWSARWIVGAGRRCAREACTSPSDLRPLRIKPTPIPKGYCWCFGEEVGHGGLAACAGLAQAGITAANTFAGDSRVPLSSQHIWVERADGRGQRFLVRRRALMYTPDLIIGNAATPNDPEAIRTKHVWQARKIKGCAPELA